LCAFGQAIDDTENTDLSDSRFIEGLLMTTQPSTRLVSSQFQFSTGLHNRSLAVSYRDAPRIFKLLNGSVGPFHSACNCCLDSKANLSHVDTSDVSPRDEVAERAVYESPILTSFADYIGRELKTIRANLRILQMHSNLVGLTSNLSVATGPEESRD
jgi:hypothetical protein